MIVGNANGRNLLSHKPVVVFYGNLNNSIETDGRLLANEIDKKVGRDNWKDVIIDITSYKQDRLISSFFCGFVKESLKNGHDIVELINLFWQVDYKWQLENIKRYIEDFGE